MQCPPACPPITITMNLPPWPSPPMSVQPAVQPSQPLSPMPAPAAAPGAAGPPAGAPAPPIFQSNAVASVTVPMAIAPHPPSPPPVVQEPAKVQSPKKRVEKLAKNMTAELLEEYDSLHKEVLGEWESWQGLAARLGPKIEHLQQASNGLKAVVSSVRDLHIPSVGSHCAKLTSCDTCAASAICGWCTSSLRCVPGSQDGVLEPGACGTSPGSDAAYSFSSCPGMGCDAYLSCGDCTQQASCGWCGTASGPGHCLQGSEWGPMGAAPGGPNSEVAATCTAQGPTWIHRNGQHNQC